MKKLTIVLSIILVVSVFGASVAFAAEKSTPTNRFSQYLEKIDERHTANIGKINERVSALTEKSSSQSKVVLSIVKRVNEELVDDFESAFSNHISLHESLAATHISLKTDFYNQFVSEATAYYNELLIQYEAGEIDGKTLSSNIREFTKSHYVKYKTIREEFQVTIADVKTTNEQTHEQLLIFKETLKAALAEDDQQTAEEALTNIYRLMVQHQEFDAYKLSLLQNITF